METLKIVVVDDHRLMLEGLRLALDAPGFELVGETNEGRKVLPLVGRLSPDVVLLDARLPDMDGLVVLERLRARHPEVTVVMISGSDDRRLIDEALARGASAFVLKTVDPADLPATIRAAAEGTVFHTVGRDEATVTEDGLTPKEREVLGHVARGLSNAEIAKELWLSQQTIKFHLTNIYRKLGVANRTEAARYAYANSLAGVHDEPREEG